MFTGQKAASSKNIFSAGSTDGGGETAFLQTLPEGFHGLGRCRCVREIRDGVKTD